METRTTAEAKPASTSTSAAVMTVEEFAAYSHDELVAHPYQYTPQFYVDQYRSLLQGGDLFFNGWALIGGGIWLMHRKLYVVGIAVFIVEHALIPLSSFLLFLLSRFVFAFVASPLYFAAAQRAVDRSRRDGVTDQERLQQLSRQGGTNQWLADLAVTASFIWWSAILAQQ